MAREGLKEKEEESDNDPGFVAVREEQQIKGSLRQVPETAWHLCACGAALLSPSNGNTTHNSPLCLVDHHNHRKPGAGGVVASLDHSDGHLSDGSWHDCGGSCNTNTDPMAPVLVGTTSGGTSAGTSAEATAASSTCTASCIRGAATICCDAGLVQQGSKEFSHLPWNCIVIQSNERYEDVNLLTRLYRRHLHGKGAAGNLLKKSEVEETLLNEYHDLVQKDSYGLLVVDSEQVERNCNVPPIWITPSTTEPVEEEGQSGGAAAIVINGTSYSQASDEIIQESLFLERNTTQTFHRPINEKTVEHARDQANWLLLHKPELREELRAFLREVMEIVVSMASKEHFRDTFEEQYISTINKVWNTFPKPDVTSQPKMKISSSAETGTELPGALQDQEPVICSTGAPQEKPLTPVEAQDDSAVTQPLQVSDEENPEEPMKIAARSILSSELGDHAHSEEVSSVTRAANVDLNNGDLVAVHVAAAAAKVPTKKGDMDSEYGKEEEDTHDESTDDDGLGDDDDDNDDTDRPDLEVGLNQGDATAPTATESVHDDDEKERDLSEPVSNNKDELSDPALVGEETDLIEHSQEEQVDSGTMFDDNDVAKGDEVGKDERDVAFSSDQPGEEGTDLIKHTGEEEEEDNGGVDNNGDDDGEKGDDELPEQPPPFSLALEQQQQQQPVVVLGVSSSVPVEREPVASTSTPDADEDAHVFTARRLPPATDESAVAKQHQGSGKTAPEGADDAGVGLERSVAAAPGFTERRGFFGRLFAKSNNDDDERDTTAGSDQRDDKEADSVEPRGVGDAHSVGVDADGDEKGGDSGPLVSNDAGSTAGSDQQDEKESDLVEPKGEGEECDDNLDDGSGGPGPALLTESLPVPDARLKRSDSTASDTARSVKDNENDGDFNRSVPDNGELYPADSGNHVLKDVGLVGHDGEGDAHSDGASDDGGGGGPGPDLISESFSSPDNVNDDEKEGDREKPVPGDDELSAVGSDHLGKKGTELIEREEEEHGKVACDDVDNTGGGGPDTGAGSEICRDPGVVLQQGAATAPDTTESINNDFDKSVPNSNELDTAVRSDQQVKEETDLVARDGVPAASKPDVSGGDFAWDDGATFATSMTVPMTAVWSSEGDGGRTVQYMCPMHPDGPKYESPNAYCSFCEEDFQRRRQELQQQRALVQERLAALDNDNRQDLQQERAVVQDRLAALDNENVLVASGDGILSRTESECLELNHLLDEARAQIQELRVENTQLMEKLVQREEGMERELKILKMAFLLKQELNYQNQQQSLASSPRQQQQRRPSQRPSQEQPPSSASAAPPPVPAPATSTATNTTATTTTTATTLATPSQSDNQEQIHARDEGTDDTPAAVAPAVAVAAAVMAVPGQLPASSTDDVNVPGGGIAGTTNAEPGFATASVASSASGVMPSVAARNGQQEATPTGTDAATGEATTETTTPVSSSIVAGEADTNVSAGVSAGATDAATGYASASVTSSTSGVLQHAETQYEQQEVASAAADSTATEEATTEPSAADSTASTGDAIGGEDIESSSSESELQQEEDSSLEAKCVSNAIDEPPESAHGLWLGLCAPEAAFVQGETVSSVPQNLVIEKGEMPTGTLSEPVMVASSIGQPHVPPNSATRPGVVVTAVPEGTATMEDWPGTRKQPPQTSPATGKEEIPETWVSPGQANGLASRGSNGVDAAKPVIAGERKAGEPQITASAAPISRGNVIVGVDIKSSSAEPGRQHEQTSSVVEAAGISTVNDQPLENGQSPSLPASETGFVRVGTISSIPHNLVIEKGEAPTVPLSESVTLASSIGQSQALSSGDVRHGIAVGTVLDDRPGRREQPQYNYPYSNFSAVDKEEIAGTWNAPGQANGIASRGSTKEETPVIAKSTVQNPVVTRIPPAPSSSSAAASTPSDSDIFTENDTFSVGPSVASSTFGEEVQSVSRKVVLDPYGDSGEYTGIILRSTGMPHGKGKMIYRHDKRTYEGGWRHGRWHGRGRATFANGDVYVGEYRFDQRHGKGRYEWNDGRIYDGMFGEDKRNGQGRFEWPDGATYEGEFKNGQREGKGVYTFPDGGCYDGSWKDGRYNGFGICSWVDGRRYEGQWVNGMADGRGVETFADGSIRHDGEWKEDEPILK